MFTLVLRSPVVCFSNLVSSCDECTHADWSQNVYHRHMQPTDKLVMKATMRESFVGRVVCNESRASNCMHTQFSDNNMAHFFLLFLMANRTKHFSRFFSSWFFFSRFDFYVFDLCLFLWSTCGRVRLTTWMRVETREIVWFYFMHQNWIQIEIDWEFASSLLVAILERRFHCMFVWKIKYT